MRNVTKRARQEKDNGPVAKPENVNQGDIQEVTNETTKNVSLVCYCLIFPPNGPFLLGGPANVTSRAKR